MITLNDVPARSKGFLTREIGDEIVIISENGKEMHTLDELGGFIWKIINGKKPILSIIDRICEEYEVGKSIAKKDTLSFLRKLMNKKLIFIKPKKK